MLNDAETPPAARALYRPGAAGNRGAAMGRWTPETRGGTLPG